MGVYIYMKCVGKCVFHVVKISYLRIIKKGWENIWLPRLQEGKTKIELERDKKYETNWVWYHTLLAIELLICNVLLLWIAIVLTIGVVK